MTNTLYYGDNIDILRNPEFFKDESIDLIYLDPPFNSKRAYNLLFSTPKGHKSEAQIEAFEDSWSWGPQAENEFDQLKQCSNTDVSEMISAMRSFLGNSDMMAYLTMMAIRLLELKRVLKPNGSIWLHCDPTASHYLKIVMDAVFGKGYFRNEIVWKRAGGFKRKSARKFPQKHDVLLFYTKSTTDAHTFHTQYKPHKPEYVRRFKPDAAGRLRRTDVNPTRGGTRTIYLDDVEGDIIDSVWTDIPPVNPSGHENLGYPTQKPRALLERIISASSNPGDIVLDPFCGCGTAIYAAQNLGRKWIGIDITHLAISLIERHLREAFPGIAFKVEGTPTSIEGARDLAVRDKYQFQHWATALVGAQSYKNKKKGADSGIDGLIFPEEGPGKHSKIIVSVKGGENVGDAMLKDLIATVEAEKAQMGLFVTLAPPTGPMKVRATAAGYYTSANGVSYPRIQILVIEDLLSGKVRPEYFNSRGGSGGFKRARPITSNAQPLPLSAYNPPGEDTEP